MLSIVALVLGSLTAPQAAAAETGVRVELMTREGQVMRGRLAPAPDGRIGLRAPDFAEVLEILPERVASLRALDADESDDDASAQFAFELVTGERLHGQVLDLTAESWSVDATGLGPIVVRRAELLSVENLGGGSLVFNGPSGLAGWSQKGRGDPFEVGDEGLRANNPKAGLERAFGLDEARDVRIELAWNGAPRFRLGVGHGSTRRTKEQAVTVEVWGESLVAWRSVGETLELVELRTDIVPTSSLLLSMKVSPETITFFDQDGDELGEIGRPDEAGPRLSLANDGEHLELRSLRVLDSSEGPPPARMAAAAITGLDAENAAFTTAEGLVPLRSVLGLDGEPSVAVAPPIEGDFWLRFADGRRICGPFLGVSEAGLRIQPAWSAAPVTCALEGLDRIEVAGEEGGIRRRRSSKSFLVTSSGEVAGELDSISVEGRINWKLDIAEGTASVDPSSVERVVINRTTAYFVSGRKFPHYLRLRSGDSFRCKLLSISEDELQIESAFGGEHTIDAALVKAVELDLRAMDRFRKLFDEEEDQGNEHGIVRWGSAERPRTTTSEGFDAESLDRALSLPRKYKKRRFEHLVLARTGDFLRTELVSWSEDGARYPGLSDETRLIPSNRIAAVIWLDESEEERSPTGTARVVLDERTQLTMNLSGTEDGKLIGSSVILGDLRIDLTHVMSIELDPEVIAAGSPYEDWVLRPMREPFPEPEGAAPKGGPAVGEPALETGGADLEGVDFALANYLGKVVLLDFWGHW